MSTDIKLLVSIVAIVIVAFILVILFIRLARRRRASSSQQNEQIYIGNLPYRANERELRDYFSSYGQIVDVRVVKDRRTGRSKGYAFITFSSAREANKSLVLHGTEMDGRSMVVRIAKPR